MPLLNVILPGTTSIFFSYLMRIASFEVISIGSMLEENLNMTPRDPINQNFETIGFDSMYCLINLGSMLIFMILFPIFVAFEFPLRFMHCKYVVVV